MSATPGVWSRSRAPAARHAVLATKLAKLRAWAGANPAPPADAPSPRGGVGRAIGDRRSRTRQTTGLCVWRWASRLWWGSEIDYAPGEFRFSHRQESSDVALPVRGTHIVDVETGPRARRQSQSYSSETRSSRTRSPSRRRTRSCAFTASTGHLAWRRRSQLFASTSASESEPVGRNPEAPKLDRIADASSTRRSMSTSMRSTLMCSLASGRT